MAQQAQQQAVAPVVVHDPVFINTAWGAVTVYGHQHVSKKDLVILGHCLTMQEFSIENGDHGVRMVMFRDDNRPFEMRKKKDEKGKKTVMVKAPLMASCVPDAQAIVINLEHTFLTSAEGASAENEWSSIRACFHRNLILNYLHEIHHMERLHKVGMAELSDEERKDLEDQAQEWSLTSLYELAKTVDIEPAHHAESSYLSSALMALLAEEKDEWSKRQRHMLENNIMYDFPAEKDKHEGLTLMSFKGVCLLMSGDDHNSPEWKKDTVKSIPVSSSEVKENIDKVMAPHEPVVSTIAGAFSEQAVADAEAMDIPDPNMMDYGEDDGNYVLWQPTYSAPMATSAPITPDTSMAAEYPIAGQPTVAPARTTTPAPAQVIVYPPTGLTLEQTRDVVFGVYNKIFDNIFKYCGRLVNSDLGFDNPEAVYTHPIELTELEKAVVVRCDCLDVNGRWCPIMPTTLQLRGFVMKNTRLPAYKIYINKCGYEDIRLLLPQNPATRDSSGNYKKTALMARSGDYCIMYVTEGKNKENYTDPTIFYYKRINKVWEACQK